MMYPQMDADERRLEKHPHSSASICVHLRIIFSLAVLCLSGCSGKPTPSPAAKHYEEGLRLAQAGEYPRAVNEWQLAIAMDPADPRPYFALAARWEQAGQFDRAVDVLEKLALARPATPHLDCRVAQLLFLADRPERAFERAERAVATEPGCAIAHTIRGMTLEDAEEQAAAITELETAHRLDPRDERITLTLAQVLGRAGRRDEAARVVDEALAANPRSPEAHFMRGWLEARTPDRAAAAEAALRRALSLEPDHTRSLAELGALLARQGRFREARAPLERARAQRPDDPALARDLALVYRRLGDARAPALERAAAAKERLETRGRAARRRQRAHPRDAAANLELARLERERGDAAEALERVRAVLRQNPNDPAALRLMHELLAGR
jgi:tetratricopeptide (TPR) repeat protein